MLKLRYNLFREKRASGPDKQFKRSLQDKLQAAFDEQYPSRLVWYQMPAFRYSMVTLIALIVVSTTGVGAYAYNSPEVTEGTILYPVKRAIERVEEKVVERRAPEVKARFYLKQIERREAEQRVIERVRSQEFKAKSLQVTEEKIDRTEGQLEKVNQALIDASTTIRDAKVIEQVQKRLEARKERLEIKIEKTNEKREEIQQKLNGNYKEIHPVKLPSLPDGQSGSAEGRFNRVNLNLNPQPYEKSNHGVSGDDGSVGNGNASSSEATIEKSKANGKSVWSRVKRVFNADTSKVRTQAGDDSR